MHEQDPEKVAALTEAEAIFADAKRNYVPSPEDRAVTEAETTVRDHAKQRARDKAILKFYELFLKCDDPKSPHQKQIDNPEIRQLSKKYFDSQNPVTKIITNLKNLNRLKYLNEG